MNRVHMASAALMIALVWVSAGTAHADTVSFPDRRGDASARYDLTRVTITNGATTVRTTVTVRDLRGDRTQIFGFSVLPVSGDAGYMLTTVRRAHGRTSGVLTRYASDEPLHRVACRIESGWRLVADKIRISFPRTCIEAEGAFKSSFYIGAGDGTAGDPADWTKGIRVAQG